MVSQMLVLELEGTRGGGDAVHRRVRRISFGRESCAFMLVGSRGLSGLWRVHVHATLIKKFQSTVSSC